MYWIKCRRVTETENVTTAPSRNVRLMSRGVTNRSEHFTGRKSKTTAHNSDDPDVKREAQQNIRNDTSIANSTTTCKDLVAAEAVCGKDLRTGTESSDADGNHRKDQSVTAPKEMQLTASGAEAGEDVSGSILLRSCSADDADVARIVTNMN